MKKTKGNWVLYLGPVANDTWVVQLNGTPSLINRIVAKMAGLNYIHITDTKL